MENILSMIGLAMKAGRVEIGEEPVGSATRAKKARLVIVAKDAAPSSQRRAASFANTGNCILLTIPANKDELGRSVGRTSCAMLAITEIGFADAIVKKLALIDPEKYASVSEALSVKAKRAAERKKEQLQHEKNLRNGKKRVVAVPEKKEEPKQTAKVQQDREEREVRKYHRDSRSNKQFRPAKINRPRFEGSLPVKKGKGSKKK